MSMSEPTAARLRHPLARGFAATRPGFLAVTFAGALAGTAFAHAQGAPVRALDGGIAIGLVLVAHAGINVLNDYFDAASGADAGNDGRVFPYTGGSRMIQNGVMTPRATLVLGVSLLALVVPVGLWLAWRSDPGLVWIGLAGLALGWAYSAPPIALMARGLGEAAVAAGFLLVFVGADLVQRHAFAAASALAGLPHALLVAGILFINEFPDRSADARVGKRTLVVRLGPQVASRAFVVLVVVAHALVPLLVAMHVLPALALVALLAALPSSVAAVRLARDANAPGRLAPAIRATIAAAILHALLLAAASWLSGPQVAR